MMSLDNPLTGIFDDIIEFFEGLANSFNFACVHIFRNGNVILFLGFLLMGVGLLINAKEREYKEKVYARNLEFVKKRGRVGTLVCIILAVAFLSKGLLVFLDWIFTPLATPIFFSFGPFKNLYANGISTEAVASFNLWEASLFYLFSLFSLISIVMVIYGIYLIIFNKIILRTKIKPFKVLVLGIILAIVYGIPTSVRLMICKKKN